MDYRKFSPSWSAITTRSGRSVCGPTVITEGGLFQVCTRGGKEPVVSVNMDFFQWERLQAEQIEQVMGNGGGDLAQKLLDENFGAIFLRVSSSVVDDVVPNKAITIAITIAIAIYVTEKRRRLLLVDFRVRRRQRWDICSQLIVVGVGTFAVCGSGNVHSQLIIVGVGMFTIR